MPPDDQTWFYHHARQHGPKVTSNPRPFSVFTVEGYRSP